MFFPLFLETPMYTNKRKRLLGRQGPPKITRFGWKEPFKNKTCGGSKRILIHPGKFTLPETNIAMENPHFWWYLPGKMGIFMGYVSFREGNILSPQNGGLVQRVFLSIWVMFSFQPLIFRAVPCCTWMSQEVSKLLVNGFFQLLVMGTLLGV